MENTGAYILAGGHSRRMGRDKALIKLGDKMIIENIAELLIDIFGRAVIVANKNNSYQVECTKIIIDEIENIGPIGGIYTALKHSNYERNFVISCDMPFVNRLLIEFLTKYETDNPIIITKERGNLQPLCGIYNKNIINVMENFINETLDKGNMKRLNFTNLFTKISLETIEITDKSFYHENLLFNINDRNDLEKAKRSL